MQVKEGKTEGDIAINKRVCPEIILFLYENICCGYSLEAPCRGTSNE